MSQTETDISGSGAITAESEAGSVPSYVRTALSTALELSDRYGFFTEPIHHKDAQRRGGRSISNGYEAGIRAGSAAILNGPTHETLMLELQMLRIAVAALSEEAVKREQMVEHYRELAETYAEYCQEYRGMLER